jgi:uncharacterized protein YcgI (DUF1989 family)
VSAAPEVVQELIIPACEGRALVVLRGQVLRLTLIDGIQVADCTFLNADDHREVYHAGQTVALNLIEGTGTMRRVGKLYSKPPRENVMMTVVDDPVGTHFVWNGGRCSRMVYALLDGITDPHRTCQDNLAEALAPYGLTGDDVPDVFNAFMNVDVIEDRQLVIKTPEARKGDYLDLRAEMNVLAAISACPRERSPSTGLDPKRLLVQVLA